jgi:galactoside O-acetyltransferase
MKVTKIAFQYVSKILQAQAWGIIEWVVGWLPGPLGSRLRYLYWKCRLGSLGKGVRFGIGVRIYSPSWVHIGDYCWIDDYVIIVAGPLPDNGRLVYRKPNPYFRYREGEVVIGERVHIAPFVLLQGHGGLQIGNCLTIAAGAKVYSLSHHYRDLTGFGAPDTVWKFVGLVSPEEQALICSPVVIGDNAAVGLNSVVLPGSTIGQNAWLGAQSLLCGEIPPNAIATGIPAKVIRKRFQ